MSNVHAEHVPSNLSFFQAHNYARNVTLMQGRRKQSADGQAQLDVGGEAYGEAANNLLAKRAAKICTYF